MAGGAELPFVLRAPIEERGAGGYMCKYYGVSEGTVCRTIQKIENVLMKSGEFRLPGRKALQPSDTLIEVVLIDATEQPIERPKKSNADTTVAKRSLTPRKRS